MPLYGILKGSSNTGADNELAAVFSTPLTVRSNNPAFVSDTVSLRRRTASQNAQRWEIDAMIVPGNGSADYLIHSVQFGHEKTFNVRMPQVTNLALADANKTATLASAVAAGSDVINVGWSPSNGKLAAGEFIKFAGDTKVYLVVDASDGVSGIRIFPKTRTYLSYGAAISHGAKVTLSAKYDTDTLLGMTFIDGVLMDPGAAKIVEAL